MCIDITFIVLPNKTSNLRSQIRVFEIYYKCIFCHIFYASTPLNSYITKLICIYLVVVTFLTVNSLLLMSNHYLHG